MNTQSILSKELTSKTYHNSFSSGFIDKLELDAKKLNHHIRMYEDNLKSLNVNYRYGRFRKGGHYYLEYTTIDGYSNYILYSWHTKIVYKYILNPSHFTDYEEFRSCCLEPLGAISDIESLPITRIDKAIDISLSFS